MGGNLQLYCIRRCDVMPGTLVSSLPTLWLTQDVGAGGGSHGVLLIAHNPSVSAGTI